MTRNLSNLFSQVLYDKMPIAMLVSVLFLIITINLDYTVTQIASAYDSSMEGNTLARLWWEITGPFRFIEIPLWMMLVLTTASFILLYSPFLAILWINFLAFQHLFGFLTWLPYGLLDFLYVLPDFEAGYAISLMSFLLSIPLTLTLRALLPR